MEPLQFRFQEHELQTDLGSPSATSMNTHLQQEKCSFLEMIRKWWETEFQNCLQHKEIPGKTSWHQVTFHMCPMPTQFLWPSVQSGTRGVAVTPSHTCRTDKVTNWDTKSLSRVKLWFPQHKADQESHFTAMNTRVWVTNLILYKSNYTLYKEYKAVLMFPTACYKNQFNYKGEFLGQVLFHN